MSKALGLIIGIAAVVAIISVGWPYIYEFINQQAIASYPNEWIIRISNGKEPTLKILKRPSYDEEAIVSRWEDVTADNVASAILKEGKNSIYFPAVNFGTKNKREWVVVTPMNKAFPNVVELSGDKFTVVGFSHKKQKLMESYAKLQKEMGKVVIA